MKTNKIQLLSVKTIAIMAMTAALPFLVAASNPYAGECGDAGKCSFAADPGQEGDLWCSGSKPTLLVEGIPWYVTDG